MSIVRSIRDDADERELADFLQFGDGTNLTLLQLSRWDRHSAEEPERSATGRCAACGVRTGVRRGAAFCSLTTGEPPEEGWVFLLCPSCNAAVDAGGVEGVVEAVCMRIEHGPGRRA